MERRDNKNRILKTGESQGADSRYRFSYTDSAGRRHSVYAWKLVKSDKTPPGKKETLSLRELEKQILRDDADGILSDRGNVTLERAVEEYLESRKKELRPNTLKAYRNAYRLHLKGSGLEKRKLKDIRFSDIRRIYVGMLERGLSIQTVQTLHGLLCPTFRNAVKDNVIRSNPAQFAWSDVAHMCKKPKKDVQALSKRQQAAFVQFVRTFYPRRLPMVTVLLGTGIRAAEFSALSWDCIDMDGGIMRIEKEMTYVDGITHIGLPKTSAGVRSIPLIQSVRDALAEEREYQRSEGVRHNAEIDGYTDFCFLDADGLPHKPCNASGIIRRLSKSYGRACKENALDEWDFPPIEPFGCHVLRHSYATRLLEMGVNPKTVQRVMGHSSYGVTMDIYATATDDFVRDEIKAVEGEIV